MHDHNVALFMIILGVAVIPFLARRLRIPSAALEILFGVLLFNLVLRESQDWFRLLGEIGFIYLMFIAGMELDLRALRRSGKLHWYIMIPLLSFTVTPLLFMALGQSYFFGLAVAMISAGIVIPVLKEMDLLRTDLGQDVVGVALMGELLSILVLTLIDAYHLHGFSWEAVLALVKLALLFSAAFIALKLLYLLAWWNPERVEKVMESEDPVEEGIRMVVTVAFTGGMIASSIEAEPILGSFLAGAIFGHVFRSKERFEEKINALGFGFLIPFFFIGVGAQLDLKLLLSPQTLLFASFLTVMVLVSNLWPLLFLRPLDLSLVEGGAMAVLLSAPLSMIVVAGTLGQKMGLIPVEASGALILSALFASILYPTLFRPLRHLLDQK